MGTVDRVCGCSLDRIWRARAAHPNVFQDIHHQGRTYCGLCGWPRGDLEELPPARIVSIDEAAAMMRPMLAPFVMADGAADDELLAEALKFGARMAAAVIAVILAGAFAIWWLL